MALLKINNETSVNLNNISMLQFVRRYVQDELRIIFRNGAEEFIYVSEEDKEIIKQKLEVYYA